MVPWSALTLPVTLLAFGFAAPFLLWGLALGAIPIVVHLLHKRRYRETSWAATRFLLEAVRKSSRRTRLEQLVLLTVRTLILILLPLALAQPFVESFGALFEGGTPTHRILVLDATYSMGRLDEEGRPLFEQAREIALEVVEKTGRGDALNLVVHRSGEPRAVVREAAYRRDQVEEEVRRLTVSDERGDLVGTLQAVAEVLEGAPEGLQREVVLVSDFQLVDWSPGSTEESARVRELLEEIDAAGRLTFVDLGSVNAPNIALTDLVAEEAFASTDRTARLTASLRSFGDATANELPVEFHVDGRLAGRVTVDVPPRQDVTVSFEHTFTTAGDHVVTAKLPDDLLPADNVRTLALPVKDRLRVLLVDGKPSGKLMAGATDRLKLALAPDRKGRPWNGFVEPRVVTEGQLTEVDLSRYDAVFVCNVGLFTEREATVLQRYVETGGGLVVSLGDRVRAENYNDLLFDAGDGLLPARLGDVVQSDEDGFEFDPVDYDHPIIAPFEGNPDSGLTTARTLTYVKAEVPPDSATRTVLRFTSGDPAVLDAEVGQGRSVLVTTSLNTEWGAWPVWHSFPPMMELLVRHVVAGRWRDRQLEVGQPLVRSFPNRAFSGDARITRPDGRSVSVAAEDTGAFSRVSYANTDRSGTYTLDVGPPVNREEVFAVNLRTAESDLARVSDVALVEGLLAGVDFTRAAEWQQHPWSTSETDAPAGLLSGWLLAAVFCLLFVEQLMAWRFAYGLGLVYVLTAGVAVWQVSLWSTVAAVLAGIVFAAAPLVLFRKRLPAFRPRSLSRSA